MPSQTLDREDVSEEDVRLFRSSLLGRRFPGLKDLSDRAVADILRKDRKKNMRTLEHRTRPKTEFAATTRPQAETTNIWYPVNPSQARETAKRHDSESFIGIGTPYDADHREFAEDRTADEAKRSAGMPFKPSSTSQAKDSIRVDYYLNSKDAEGKHAELAETRRRAEEMAGEYRATQTARRGQMLVG